MSKNLHLFLILVLVSSCASFKMGLLNPKQTLSPQIPMLEVRIDKKSLETAFMPMPFKITQTADTLQANLKPFRDIQVQDAITIFTREVENNICKANGPNKNGYAVCRIIAADMMGNGLWVLVPPLFVLCGVPSCSFSVEVSAQIDIYDNDNNFIKSYSAVGRGKEYQAMYWGYAGETMMRTATIRALLNAMNEIKVKIQNDQAELAKKLALPL